MLDIGLQGGIYDALRHLLFRSEQTLLGTRADNGKQSLIVDLSR